MSQRGVQRANNAAVILATLAAAVLPPAQASAQNPQPQDPAAAQKIQLPPAVQLLKADEAIRKEINFDTGRVAYLQESAKRGGKVETVADMQSEQAEVMRHLSRAALVLPIAYEMMASLDGQLAEVQSTNNLQHQAFLTGQREAVRGFAFAIVQQLGGVNARYTGLVGKAAESDALKGVDWRLQVPMPNEATAAILHPLLTVHSPQAALRTIFNDFYRQVPAPTPQEEAAAAQTQATILLLVPTPAPVPAPEEADKKGGEPAPEPKK